MASTNDPICKLLFIVCLLHDNTPHAVIRTKIRRGVIVSVVRVKLGITVLANSSCIQDGIRPRWQFGGIGVLMGPD